MAKIDGVIQFSGKLGQVVGMKGRNGRNFMRQRTDAVKNPRSLGQNIQRMILATVGQSIGFLKEICSNSVEGKVNGNDTLSYLRSQWMRMLRVSDIDNSPYSYAKKGSGFFVENPYMLSKGTILAPDISCIADEQTLGCSEINNLATKASELFPSIAVGDQVTIVAVSYNDNEYEQGMGVPKIVKYCRFAFKDDTTAPLIEDSAQNLVINPAAIDLKKAAGDWQKLQFTAGKINLAAFIDFKSLIACALLVSNIENKKRSTSYLTLDEDYDNTQWPAVDAYPTFGNLGTPIDVPSEVYLNNSTVPTSAEE